MAAISQEIVSQEKSKYWRKWWLSKAFDMLAASIMICKWKSILFQEGTICLN